MTPPDTEPKSEGEFLLYSAPNGEVKINVYFEDETAWLSQKADYDSKAPLTRGFFATVQNKLHWAITGMTAAELVSSSADADKPHMGLTTWKQSPSGKVLTGKDKE